MLMKKEFNVKEELSPMEIVHVSMLVRALQDKELNAHFCTGVMSYGEIKRIIGELKRVADNAKAKGDKTMENNTRKTAERLEALLKG